MLSSYTHASRLVRRSPSSEPSQELGDEELLLELPLLRLGTDGAAASEVGGDCTCTWQFTQT